MHQMKLRRVIPVVLCSTLVVFGLIQPATATTPSEPWDVKASSVTPRESLTDGLRRLALRHRAVHRREVMGARFKIRMAGEAYPRWDVDVVRFKNRSMITVATYREEQYYYWTSQLPRSAVRIRRNLTGLSIHTGTNLGDFGSIDLEMTHDGRHESTVERCEKSNELLFKIGRARGLVEGAVSLSPGLTGMPAEVATTRERVRLSRFSIMSNDCGGHSFGCYPQEELVIADGTNTNRVFTGIGFSGLFFIHETTDGDVRQTWYALAYDGSVDPVTRTPTQLTLDAQDYGPLLSGSVVFDKVGSTEPVRRGPCMVTKVSYQFASGSFDANFDAGIVTLTGPELEGTLRRYRRP